MTGHVSTTAGSVSADELGVTLMHEHVAIFSPGLPDAYPHLYDMETVRTTCIDQLRAAHQAGIRTIVDVTTPDLGRDALFIREVADAAEMQVVVATGIWLDVPRYFRAREVDDATRLFVREIETGIGRTGIRAGIIKVASDEVVTADQEKILRAAARASVQTGVTVSTHTLASARTGIRQLEILDQEGVSPDRIVIGHSTEADDVYLDALYASGATVAWDQFGTWEVTDEDGAISRLGGVLMGPRSSQTVISMDNASFVDWEPEHAGSFLHLAKVVLPRLTELGVPPDTIREITEGVPKRLLAAG
jgi:phosphotriesterase-related protein